MSKTRSSDVVIGFAIGSVIGAVAALMLAPAPGSETRRRLREIGDRARGAFAGARRAAGDRAHRIGRAFEEGRAAYVRHAGNAESGWPAAGATEVKPDEPGAA